MTASWTEEWRPIPGYEDRYQVSNLGRVRSLDRCVPCFHGETRLIKGRVLKPSNPRKGNPYLCVTLDTSHRSVPIHQLVAQAFLGPRPAGPEGRDIRHLDGNPLNNRVDNLTYGSREENIQDIYKDGRAWRKLSIPDVIDIRSRLENGESQRSIARDYGVTQGNISAIKRGRAYAWLKNDV